LLEDEGEIKKLLSELGLFSQDSVLSIEEKIRNLNMRQLDKLKLMFGRAGKGGALFTEKTRTGIKNNDFGAFADAVHTLNSILPNEKA
jgi:hypothetical protein